MTDTINQNIINRFIDSAKESDDYENNLHVVWRDIYFAFYNCRLQGMSIEDAYIACGDLRKKQQHFLSKQSILDDLSQMYYQELVELFGKYPSGVEDL